MKFSYQQIIQLSFLATFIFHLSGLLNAQKIEHHFKGITTSKGNPKELLLELQNSGYAFARLELDTILEKTDTSFLIWTVIPGNLLILDSLNFNSAHIRKKNLERILDFKRGDLFNQTKINKITERLSNAYGIRPSKQPQVLFFKNTFQIEIQTEKTKKNRIEGLLQLQNNAVTNKTTLTGNVELDVSNVLKTCERFQFLWKRPTSNTQYLETSVQLPYLFGLPFGAFSSFNAFLRDSTSAQSNFNLGIFGSVNTENGFLIFVNKSANVKFLDLSANGSTRATCYGIQYANTHGNQNIFSSGYGINYSLQSKIGQRNDLQESQKNTLGGYKFEFQYKTGGVRFFLTTRLKGEGIFSRNFYSNEALRIGGMQSVRGFLEESQSTFHYTLMQLTPGVKLNESIGLYLNCDNALLYTPQARTIGSIGLGTSILQKVNKIELSFAWPWELGNKFTLQSGRLGIQIHSYF